jgi:hypothetical protein
MMVVASGIFKSAFLQYSTICFLYYLLFLCHDVIMVLSLLSVFFLVPDFVRILYVM